MCYPLAKCVMGRPKRQLYMLHPTTRTSNVFCNAISCLFWNSFQEASPKIIVAVCDTEFFHLLCSAVGDDLKAKKQTNKTPQFYDILLIDTETSVSPRLQVEHKFSYLILTLYKRANDFGKLDSKSQHVS